MPIYEYVCQDCGEKYEKLVRSSVVKIELICPKCGSEHADKAISALGLVGASSSSSNSAANARAAASNCGPVG
jgi:putative FmdB family regulatory protein